MFSFVKEYKNIEKAIVNVIVAEFFLQLINSSFLSMLPLYMKKENYSDGEIADYTSNRFLGVVVLALLIGLYIKGRKLKNLFYISKSKTLIILFPGGFIKAKSNISFSDFFIAVFNQENPFSFVLQIVPNGFIRRWLFLRWGWCRSLALKD